MLHLRHMNPQIAKAESGEKPNRSCAIPASPTSCWTSVQDVNDRLGVMAAHESFEMMFRAICAASAMV